MACPAFNSEDVASWFAECKRLAGEQWDWFAAWYSFQTAFDDGLSPIEAIADCAEWLDTTP